MKAILTALVLATAITAPAQAQAWGERAYEVVRDDRSWGERREWGRHGVMPERRVARIVYREGFVEIEDIRLRSDLYLVDAVRPNGAVFRLELDAFDGRLVSRERIGWSRVDDRRESPRRRSSLEFRINLGG